MTQRKTPFLLVIALLTGLVLACGDFASFTFTEESDVITIEGSSGLLADLMPTRIPLEVDLEQELEEQDASGAESVHLIDMQFEMTDDTDEPDFDFIDEITITVASRDDDSDLPERELAWSDPVPEGEDQFHLEVDDDLDLKPYAEEGLRLRTQANGTSPDEDAKFQVSAEFRVNVM